MSMSSLTEEALGGLSAGVVGTIIGFPLDSIKARMQVNQGANQSLWATSRAVVQKEGILALYHGVAPPLISLSILNTLNFTSYSYLQQKLEASRGWDVRNAFAGTAVGPLAAVVSTVENLVKTQMQLNHLNGNQYSSSWDCVQQIIRSRHGLSLLYTGHLVNTARETVFLLTYFGLYEGFREQLVHVSIYHLRGASNTVPKESHPWAIPVSGGLAGALAWSISFPLDCVRAGVQGQALPLTNNKQAYPTKTAWQVFAHLMHTKGIRGLYAGVTPSIVRAFLVSGTRFTAYETALWLMRGGRDAHAPLTSRFTTSKYQ